MGRGIVVPRGGERRPSEHYSAHFTSSSAALARLTKGLIDGNVVTLSGPVTIDPNVVSSSFAQFAVIDESDGSDGERAFVVALAARTTRDLEKMPGDPRGTPSLLSDLHNGRRWDVYNCHIIDFQVWGREHLYRGDWPKVPVGNP